MPNTMSHITVSVPGLPTLNVVLDAGETASAVLNAAAAKFAAAVAAGEVDEPRQQQPDDAGFAALLAALTAETDQIVEEAATDTDALDAFIADQDEDDDEDDEQDEHDFALGDAVRYTGGSSMICSTYAKEGDVGTVVARSGDSPRVDFHRGHPQFVETRCLELVPAGDAMHGALTKGDRVVLAQPDGCSDARVGSLGTIDYVYNSDSVSVNFDDWRSQMIYTTNLARVIAKSPEKGDKVIRTGSHKIYGADFDGKESSVGMTGVVYRDSYGLDVAGVRWDAPLSVTSSSIYESELTVIE